MSVRPEYREKAAVLFEGMHGFAAVAAVDRTRVNIIAQALQDAADGENVECERAAVRTGHPNMRAIASAIRARRER